jgi:hypothetical protein
MRASKSLSLTDHAAARMQQRGIRSQALEVLLDYGRIAHDHRGAEIVFFDKKARSRLAKANASAAKETERLSRTYAILGADGAVITVGHRYRRILRD